MAPIAKAKTRTGAGGPSMSCLSVLATSRGALSFRSLIAEGWESILLVSVPKSAVLFRSTRFATPGGVAATDPASAGRGLSDCEFCDLALAWCAGNVPAECKNSASDLESDARDSLQSAPNRKCTRIDPAIVIESPARPHHGHVENVLPPCSVSFLSLRSRVGRFPPVTGSALCRVCSCPRYEKTRKGQDRVEHRRKAGRLHPHHQQDHHLTGAGRPAVDETLERRTCGGEDHAPASP